MAAATALSLIVALASRPEAESRSCSTAVLNRGDTLLVAHNLDESRGFPGLLVANPRGLAKRNWSYDDVKSGRAASRPRLDWVARYGSLTWNVFGRELPDGGVNEAGLYVAEMTLLATVWPADDAVARLYHHQWIQYLLDNFATVEEALASLRRALPEGHCRWHFLLADRGGDVAVVEFLAGRPEVFRGGSLPWPILGNDPYRAELEDLVRYAGFGGDRDPAPRYEREDPRFRWAAAMLREDAGAGPGPERAFEVLQRMNLGTTRWSTVADLGSGRIWFRTEESPAVKSVALSELDLACSTTPLAVDIHARAAGGAAARFVRLTDESNRRAIESAWEAVDAGVLGNLFFKGRMARGMAAVAPTFGCAGR